MSDQPTPASPTGGSIATPTLPPQERTLCFPLTRRATVRQQMAGMALYALLMALSIAAINLVAYLRGGPVVLLLPFFLLGASSALCGTLFGSWRGTLVSVCSFGGGLLLIHLLNTPFPHLEDSLDYSSSLIEAYLIPGPLAALVVGAIYDRRHDENWLKSILTMLLGMTIALVGFSTQGELGPLAGCYFLFMIPLSTFPLVGIEWLIQKYIASRKSSPNGA